MKGCNSWFWYPKEGNFYKVGKTRRSDSWAHAIPSLVSCGWDSLRGDVFLCNRCATLGGLKW